MNQKARHALRIVVGLYLAYLGWQLFTGAVLDGTGNVMLGAILGPVFAIVGLLYAINSIRKVLAIRKEEMYGAEGEEEESQDDRNSNAQIAEDNMNDNMDKSVATKEGVSITDPGEDMDTVIEDDSEFEDAVTDGAVEEIDEEEK